MAKSRQSPRTGRFARIRWLALPRMRVPVIALVLAWLWTQAATSARAANAPSPPQDASERVVPPVAQGGITVVYPAALAEQDSAPSGRVVVKFTVGADGLPSDATIEQALHPELDALALDAIGRLRYAPATLGGQPVAVIIRVAVDFSPPVSLAPSPSPAEEAAETEQDSGSPPLAGSESGPPEDEAAGPVRIAGTVLEAGDRTPVTGAQVLVTDAPAGAKPGVTKKKRYASEPPPAWTRAGTSDDTGSFAVRGVPAGTIRVVILVPGYERFEAIESLPAGQRLQVRYYLQRLPENPYRTVVQTRAREEVTRRSISVAEITNLPGTQGDALRAIQNFPGVARSPFSLGLLVIRGTGPQNSAIYLGGHEIPQLFHFGGLTSVFNSDILERIDFIPGNFGSRYGDAIGGIVDVTPRFGRRDGFHGYIDSDIFDTGILFEGPIGKGSFAVSGRRSYIDFILPRVIPDDAGLELSVAPRYYDYQVLFDYPVGPAGGHLGFRGFGSDDRTVLVASNQNDISTDDRNQFETKQYFHRLDLYYEKTRGPWQFSIIPSYRYDLLQLGIGSVLDLDLATHNFNTRAEVVHKITRRSRVTLGTEFRTYWFNIRVDAPPIPNGGGPGAPGGGSIAERFITDVGGNVTVPALYLAGEIGLGERFTIAPEARFSVYTGLYNTATMDPRLRLSWKVAERTTLKGGIGIYSQVPSPAEASGVFGNPRLGPERALQNSVGVTQGLPRDIEVDATAFYNYQWDLSTPSTQVVRRPDGTIGPETYANSGRGRIYGLELLLRKQLTGRLFGWVAYTLSRSERQESLSSPFRAFAFDQTHILTLVGVVRLPKNWQVGARFRLVSGNPSTPFVGAVYDSTSATYVPIEGPTNSERTPTFHQLDLRIDKRWVLKRWSASLYLDVQNVYNQQNTEFWNYSYDFSERAPIAGLPIIPSLGTKIEF